MELSPLSLLLLMMSLVHSGLLEVVPTLTVQPNWTERFSGESVTLTCELTVQTGTAWTYIWYRNEQEIHSSTENYYVIKETEEHQDQKYKCYSRGQRQTQWSNEVTLTVRARPKPILRVSPQNPVFTGESLTLSCELQSTGWQFLWSKDSEESKISTAVGTKSIQSVQLSDGGQYRCRSQRGTPPYHTEYSDPITVTVTGPTLTVQPNWTEMFIGETVTLTCALPVETKTAWSYIWYRNGQRIHSSTENYYVIKEKKEHQDQKYKCYSQDTIGQRQTDWSNEVTLTVRALPSATLTVEHKWSPVFTGESVTLKCEIQSDSNWRFHWYKGSSSTAVHQSEINTLNIRSPVDQDKYWCRGERYQRPTSSQDSNTVTLTVKARPKPVLRVSPQNPVFTGESLTLTCELQSTGWQFLWSKDSEESKISTAVGTKSIQSVQLSDGGQYRCRSQRGTPPYDTEYSDPIMVTVTDGRSHLKLVGMAVGSSLVLLIIIIIIIIIVLWVYKTKKGGTAAETSDETYTQGMTQNTEHKNKDADPDHVTYALIEVKPKKKNMKKQEDTSVGVVYSELKQNASEGQVAGLSVQTYEEIN